MLYGPNTNLGHNSIIYMLESQIHYVMACLREVGMNSASCVDVARRVQSEFNDSVRARAQAHGLGQGCDSWYKLASGKHTNNWPGFTFAYRRLTRFFDPGHYDIYPPEVREKTPETDDGAPREAVPTT